MFRNSLRPTLIGFATPTLLGVTYASAAGPYEITVARWRDAARRYLSSKCLRKIPRPAAADAFDKTGSISFGVKARSAATSPLFRVCTGAFARKAIGPSSTNHKTATTRSRGRRHCRNRTPKSVCSADRVSAPHKFLTAIASPHLPGICPVVTVSNYRDGWTYQGGAFEQWLDESWTTGLAMNTMRRHVESSGNPLLLDEHFAAHTLSPRSRPSVEKAPRLTSKMAGASELRRVLEAVGNRRALQADSRISIFDRRLVRHFSWRIAAELYTAEERSRHKKRGAGRDCTSRSAGMRAASATSRFTSGLGIPICHKKMKRCNYQVRVRPHNTENLDLEFCRLFRARL